MTVADGDVGGPGPPCNPRGHPQSGGAVQSAPGTNNPSSGSGSNPILMASPAGNNPINLSEMTFEKFKEEMPSQAEGFLGQLREISGKKSSMYFEASLKPSNPISLVFGIS